MGECRPKREPADEFAREVERRAEGLQGAAKRKALEPVCT